MTRHCNKNNLEPFLSLLSVEYLVSACIQFDVFERISIILVCRRIKHLILGPGIYGPKSWYSPAGTPSILSKIYAPQKSGPWYRLETFFSEEENHTQAPRWASNHGPLCVNVEIKSRSPQETEDFTGMLEKVEMKGPISQKNDLDR